MPTVMPLLRLNLQRSRCFYFRIRLGGVAHSVFGSRYLTTWKRVLIFPEVTKSVAGTHDLGSGHDEICPGLTLGSSLESANEFV